MPSKARHGKVTHILLNLCVSLTILLIVLYAADQFADSRIGCRVANIMRYYLVLVSLFWNGIEAHNMYRMLVKVFNTGAQSHFVLKAAVVAWGRPTAIYASTSTEQGDASSSILPGISIGKFPTI